MEAVSHRQLLAGVGGAQSFVAPPVAGGAALAGRWPPPPAVEIKEEHHGVGGEGHEGGAGEGPVPHEGGPAHPTGSTASNAYKRKREEGG